MTQIIAISVSIALNVFLIVIIVMRATEYAKCLQKQAYQIAELKKIVREREEEGIELARKLEKAKEFENDLISERKVLIAKCEFLEACNTEVQNKKLPKKKIKSKKRYKYARNELKNAVKSVITFNAPKKLTTNNICSKLKNAGYYSVRKSLNSLMNDKDNIINKKKSGKSIYYWIGEESK